MRYITWFSTAEKPLLSKCSKFGSSSLPRITWSVVTRGAYRKALVERRYPSQHLVLESSSSVRVEGHGEEVDDVDHCEQVGDPEALVWSSAGGIFAALFDFLEDLGDNDGGVDVVVRVVEEDGVDPEGDLDVGRAVLEEDVRHEVEDLLMQLLVEREIRGERFLGDREALELAVLQQHALPCLHRSF